MRTRTTIAGAAGLTVLLLAAGAVPGVAQAAPGTGGGKVAICHRTHSVTNPYRLITVSQSAVTSGSTARNHTHHTGPVFDPNRVYPPNEKVWGDIIPSGKATLESMIPPGVRCGAMSAAQFYNVEREAGVPREHILEDLAEQGAEGDEGVSFTTLVYTGSDAGLQAEERGETPTDEPVDPPVEDPLPPAPEPVDPPVEDPPPPAPEPVEPPVEDPPAPVDPPVEDPAPPAPAPVDPPVEDPAPPAPAPLDPPVSDPPPPAEPPAPAPPVADPTPPAPPVTDPTPPAPPATVQTIDGTVWLDLDRDGVHDPGEIGFPGAVVELYRLDATAPVRALAAGRGGRVGAATLALGTAERVGTGRTDTRGAFAFTGLPAGTYRVVAHHSRDLSVTWDDDGGEDAVVQMDLPAGGHGRAAVGLVGPAAMDARLVTTDGRKVADTAVVVRGAAADASFGTDDDLVLTVPVEDGRVSLSGLPSGLYRVETTDGSGDSAALTLAAGGAAVSDVALPGATAASTPAPQQPEAPLVPGPIAPAAVPGTPVVWAVTTPGPVPARLAATGSASAAGSLLAAMLVAAGAALTAGSRRAGRDPVATPQGRHRRA